MRQPVPFGKYLLLDRISVGGMAEVFKAKSFGVEGFEKIIAIKRILPSMGEDRDFIDMFIDEAKIAGQLSHANVCQIYELGRIQGAHFIAMEYIWGKDLLQIQNRLQKRREAMSTAMACFIVAKVCEGLDYAHRRKDATGRPLEIVHRDCSPQNVLVSYSGEVKLIDFGIAKAASRSARTNAGVLKGKFGYMSPEQVRGLPLDRRSDIFSLGTILHECLSGGRLFLGESDFSTLEKVRNADVLPLSQINSAIPSEVDGIVMRALARDPADRYQNASEMRDDLQAFLKKERSVFTNRTLSDGIKQLFSAELAREKGMMDRYRRIGRDGLISGVPQAVAKLDVVAELGELPPLQGDPTVLDGPVDEAPTTLASPRSREATPYDDNPTEIFGEIGGPGGAGDAPGAAVGVAGSQGSAKVLVTGSIPTDHSSAPRAVTEMGGHGPPPAGSGPFDPGHRNRSGSVPMPLFAQPEEGSVSYTASVDALARAQGRPPPRSRHVRDIIIGLSIAVVVLAVVVVLKFTVLDKSKSEVEATAAGIVVVVVDRSGAEVWLDDEKMGEISGEEPLKMPSVPVGKHLVRVKHAGFQSCEYELSVVADGVEVVNCRLTAAEATGTLVLEGLTAGHRVTVDGHQLSAKDQMVPIPVRAGVEHSVTVRSGDEVIDQFVLTVTSGEERRRRIDEGAGGGNPDAGTGHSSERPESDDSGRDRDDGDSSDEEGDHKPREADGRDPDKKPEDRTVRTGGSSGDVEPGDDGPAEVDGEGVGYFTAYTTPFARVYIDDEDTGKMTPIAPRAKISLVPGLHKVTFVVGEQRFDYMVKIATDKEVNLVRDLPVE